MKHKHLSSCSKKKQPKTKQISFHVTSPQRPVGVPTPPGWETWQAARGTRARCVFTSPSANVSTFTASQRSARTDSHLSPPANLIAVNFFRRCQQNGTFSRKKGGGGAKRCSSDNESFLSSTQGQMLQLCGHFVSFSCNARLRGAKHRPVKDFRGWQYKLAKKKGKKKKLNGTALFFTSDFLFTKVKLQKVN